MKLSKSMRQRIDSLTVFNRHLSEYERTVNDSSVPWWWDKPVSEWSREEAALFDFVCRIEADLKAEIFNVLTGNHYGV